MSSTEPGSIKLRDREYTVGVGPGERDSLMAAARLLETRMRELRGSNRMAAVDRVAVLAALNMAHEMQQARDGESGRDAELAAALQDLRRRLDSAGV